MITMKEWENKIKDTVLRMWEKGEEDNECSYVKIVEIIELNNDYLLKMVFDECDDVQLDYMIYRRLSDIILDEVASDQGKES